MAMAMPEVPQELLDRLARAEDAVQKFEFIHLVKVDACTAGLGMLYAGQKRMQEELSGFRAEAAAEFETIKTEQARQGEKLDEILRRLPEQ